MHRTLFRTAAALAVGWSAWAGVPSATAQQHLPLQPQPQQYQYQQPQQQQQGPGQPCCAQGQGGYGYAPVGGGGRAYPPKLPPGATELPPGWPPVPSTPSSRPIRDWLRTGRTPCCWASFNGYGCSSLHSTLGFMFGSCRTFFGEPCLKGPPPSPLPPWAGPVSAYGPNSYPHAGSGASNFGPNGYYPPGTPGVPVGPLNGSGGAVPVPQPGAGQYNPHQAHGLTPVSAKVPQPQSAQPKRCSCDF